MERHPWIRRDIQSGYGRPDLPGLQKRKNEDDEAVHKKTQGSKKLVVKLTKNGKGSERIVISLIAETFLGMCPHGCVPYHVNGCKSDNYINNIMYISRRELGRLTGAKARRMSVVKIDKEGEIVDVYASARECGRQNHMSYQTIIDRCNGKCRSAFAPDGFAYAWEDKSSSVKKALIKVMESRLGCSK